MAMIASFEAQKNRQAALYTSGVILLLLLILFYVKWAAPIVPPPPIEDGIEVNLGNSDQGFGTDQPFEPGDPSPQDQQNYTPPLANVSEDNNVKEVETDDKDEDAPTVTKPRVSKPDAKKLPEKEVIKTPVKNTKPVVNPTPAPPKPKAIFKGINGTGTGGNAANTYKKGGNEGINTGNGDQGKPNGDPNSKNYTGNGGTGNSGVTISRGLQGRKITGLPSFKDDFNENAKVAVDIKVDETGKVVSAVYQQRGSTTSDASMKAIAIRKALQVKFNTGGESMGTLIFNFRVTQ